MSPRRACVLFFLLTTFSDTAVAQDTTDAPGDPDVDTSPDTDPRSDGELEAEARARFSLGQLYYSQARFAEAAAEFEAAYASHPHPLLLHNLYLALRDLGDEAGAADALRRYLASATDLDAADRRLLEGRLAAMDRHLATETPVETPTPVDDVDGTPSEEVEGTPEDSAERLATPAPSGGMGVAPGAALLGIGAGVLVGAAIAGGIAEGVRGERDSMCTLAGGACPIAVDQTDYANRFSAARDAAWGLFAGGLGVAAVGATLLGIAVSETTPASDSTASVTAGCDGTGCMLSVAGAF